MRRVFSVVLSGLCVSLLLSMGGCKKEAETPAVPAEAQIPEVEQAKAPEKDALAEDLERVTRIVGFHDEMVKIVKENAADCDALAQKWGDLVANRKAEMLEDTRKSDLMIKPENELPADIEAMMVRLRKRAEYVTSDEVIGLCSGHEGVTAARGKLFDTILEMDNIVIERRKLLAFDKVMKFFEEFASIASDNVNDCEQMAAALDSYIDKNLEELKTNISKSPSFSEAPYDKVFEGVFTNVMGSNSTFDGCVKKSKAAEKVYKRFISAFIEEQGALPGQENRDIRDGIVFISGFFSAMENVVLNNVDCATLGDELNAFLKGYQEEDIKAAFRKFGKLDKNGLSKELNDMLESSMFLVREDATASKRVMLCSQTNPAVPQFMTKLLNILQSVN